jgi:hypothetical protein
MLVSVTIGLTCYIRRNKAAQDLKEDLVAGKAEDYSEAGQSEH